MKSSQYKFAVIASDVVVFSVKEGILQVLLIKMKKKPFEGKWAMPGGLVNPKESVDNAAVRILKEKSGIEHHYLEQLYTFGAVNRDPFGRVVSVAYMALLPSQGIKLRTTHEYADVAWFSIKKVPHLAYDHKEILNTAIRRLQSKLGYTNIVYNLLPEHFTLTELQSMYEVILAKKLDKRNFRKKILSLGLIKKTGKKQLGQANRPAEMYCFKNRTPEHVEIL